MDFREQKEILRLLQLCSPALPTGAFAYSQGLEFAVSAGWVNDERSASDWIQGLLKNSLANLDVPVLFRLHQAWSTNDIKNVHYWNDFLYASRDSAEFQAEERQLAQALARLLIDLGILEAVSGERNPSRVFCLCLPWGRCIGKFLFLMRLWGTCGCGLKIRFWPPSSSFLWVKPAARESCLQ